MIEAKHTIENKLPSLGDIKDGLLKMILFTNLEDVKIDSQKFNPIPVLKLTTGNNFFIEKLKNRQKEILGKLIEEAKTNGFEIIINSSFLT